MIRITQAVEIPEDELTFTTSRSGGPGGQNVNKLNTRVTLLFDLAGSPSLTASQKHRISARLATRINRNGVLRVVSQRHRSQSANREAAVERFVELLQSALARRKRRIRTKPTATSQRRRLEGKKLHSRIKKERAWRPGGDD